MRHSLPILLLLGASSVSSLLADVASQDYPLHIKVINIQAQAIDAENQVPKDCDLQNYSAYCNESRNTTVRSVMLVEDSVAGSFRLVCNTDSRWAKCALLKVGQTYDAREENHRMAVLFHDKKGHEKKHTYQLISAFPAAPQARVEAASPVPAHAEPPPPPARVQAAPQSAPSPSPAPPPVIPRQTSGETVKVSFTSTPSGAEITVDGRYSGNTPSLIALSPGVHNVVLSLAGFVPWKRELTLSEGSQVNLTATLEKAP